MPVTSAFRRRRQGDYHEFGANLGYMEVLGQPELWSEGCLKNTKKSGWQYDLVGRGACCQD